MGNDIVFMLILIVLAILIYMYELDELKFEFRQTLSHKQLKVELECKSIASIILFDRSSDRKYQVDETENIKAFLTLFDSVNIKNIMLKGEDHHNVNDMNYNFLLLSETDEVFSIMYCKKTRTLVIGERYYQLRNCFEKEINRWITSMYSPWALEETKMQG